MENNQQDYLIITKQMMEKAKTYMPIQEKCDIAKNIAKLCLVDIKTAEQNKAGEKVLAMPCLKVEDIGLKSILLMQTFLSFYFDTEISKKDKNGQELTPQQIYDYCAGGHILNQIERYKSDFLLKDTAFDLLTDYKEFKKIVDTEIYNIKANNNDGIGRFTSAIEILSTPENIKQLSDLLKGETDKLQAKILEHKEKGNNE